jgi:hypothetical protein
MDDIYDRVVESLASGGQGQVMFVLSVSIVVCPLEKAYLLHERERFALCQRSKKAKGAISGQLKKAAPLAVGVLTFPPTFFRPPSCEAFVLC